MIYNNWYRGSVVDSFAIVTPKSSDEHLHRKTGPLIKVET